MKFSVVEGLKIAINLEKQGYDFYRKAIDYIKDEELKNLFLQFADQEIEHEKRFKELAEKYSLDEEKLHYNDDDDVEKYLDAIFGSDIFKEKKMKEIDFSGLTKESALEFAMNSEKEAILYFEDIAERTEGEIKELFLKIKDEEKKHLVELNDILNK